MQKKPIKNRFKNAKKTIKTSAKKHISKKTKGFKNVFKKCQVHMKHIMKIQEK